MLSCFLFFYPLHLYVFVLIFQYYVVLLERTNKDIIYKGRRYSIDILIYAFNLNHKSPDCYEEDRKVVCLLSKYLIRDISSNIRVDSGNVTDGVNS